MSGEEKTMSDEERASFYLRVMRKRWRGGFFGGVFLGVLGGLCAQLRLMDMLGCLAVSVLAMFFVCLGVASLLCYRRCRGKPPPDVIRAMKKLEVGTIAGSVFPVLVGAAFIGRQFWQDGWQGIEGMLGGAIGVGVVVFLQHRKRKKDQRG
jgi:uncharacterized membrane protein YeaQ/YmgE (transglycosylase-associated protein family)